MLSIPASAICVITLRFRDTDLRTPNIEAWEVGEGVYGSCAGKRRRRLGVAYQHQRGQVTFKCYHSQATHYVLSSELQMLLELRLHMCRQALLQSLLVAEGSITSHS
jgi:hypothetical protein